METTITPRQSKYCNAAREILAQLGHSTNLTLLEVLRQQYPDLSATTVHRITSRLVDRGELQLAPPAQDGAMRFDSNLAIHDHFMCKSCGVLKDASFSPDTLHTIEKQFDDCHISGPITITGLCKNCIAKEAVS